MRPNAFIAFLATLALAVPGLGQSPAGVSGGSGEIVIPEPISDPLEPLNRGIWEFNTVVINRVIHPVGEGYRWVVREPVRSKINNFSRNLAYPVRVINEGLQGRWRDAHQETRRFVVNSTLGIGGFFDPATSLGVGKPEADFGQTLACWGLDTGCYFVIPILGPSNLRDSFGKLGDVGMHPIVYFSPYSYLLYFLTFNYIVNTTGDFKRLSESGLDSYAFARQASAYLRQNQLDGFRITEMPAEPASNSINAIFFSHRDPEFPDLEITRSVRIPTTGEKLEYSLFLQDNRDRSTPAPVVYVIPGLGGHRMERASLALAELVYSQGNTVICISSVFNSEFMEAASTAAVPGYAAVDNHDLHVALDCIDRDLRSRYQGQSGQRALLGYSMGAYHTLLMAAEGSNRHPHPRLAPADHGQPLMRFDRYVAINPPVDLIHGLSVLDGLYESALAWPAAERTAKIDNTFRKVAYLFDLSTKAREAQGAAAVAAVPPGLPFDRTEAAFLIGYSYRTILRDIIYSSQRRQNLGILQEPLRRYRRSAVYEEIGRYSYRDYLDRFVIPYYESGAGVAAATAGDVVRASDLRHWTSQIRGAGDLRLILSADDFLLRPGDVDWLQTLTAPSKVTLFDDGGHMGHLAGPTGQQAVARALSDL